MLKRLLDSYCISNCVIFCYTHCCAT